MRALRSISTRSSLVLRSDDPPRSVPKREGVIKSGESAPGSSALPLGFLALLGALIFGLLRQGGYHRDDFMPLVVLMGGAAVAFIAVTRDRRTILRSIGGATAIVAPLVAATAVAALAADTKTDAPATFALLAMVGLAIAVGAALAPELERTAVTGILVAGSITALTAWWGVASQSTPWGRVTEDLWRGASSLTYSNAAAAVVGPLALIALARSAQRRSWSAALFAYLLLVGLGATQSRGGGLAFLIGLACLVVVLLRRGVGVGRIAQALLAAGAGGAVATVAILTTASATTEARPALQVGALVVGGAIAVGGSLVAPRLASAVGGIAVIGFMVVVVLQGGELRGVAERRFSVSSTTTALGPDERVLFGDRAREWSEAWEQFTREPIVGHGPGVVDLRWEDEGRRLRAIFVHNEYLELAVTHGVMGLAALVASMVTVVLWLRRRPAWGDETVFLLLATGVFMLHAGVDFLWHVPILPILYATFLGLSLGPPPTMRRR